VETKFKVADSNTTWADEHPEVAALFARDPIPFKAPSREEAGSHGFFSPRELNY
jgi:hypothetical protein